MKVPPKRKGNSRRRRGYGPVSRRLNESPSEKEGKYVRLAGIGEDIGGASMKVPPKRKGNVGCSVRGAEPCVASMKVPPKRKGNRASSSYSQLTTGGLNESPSEKEGKSPHYRDQVQWQLHCLNESPSEKEGKCNCFNERHYNAVASMKVPPKRKGNEKRKCV